MTNNMRWITAIATGAVLLPTMTASAQFMADSMMAMGVANTLSAGSAGPNTSLYMGRARGAADTAKSYAEQFEQYTAATAGGGQVGMVAGGAAGMMAGGGRQMQTPQLDPMQQFLHAVNGVQGTASTVLGVIAQRDPNIQYVTALTGERVLCAVTGSMLADVNVHRIAVEKDKREEGIDKWRAQNPEINIKDDGIQDNGIAGDGIYGDVKVTTGNVISPEANRLRACLMRLLHQVEYMTPDNVVDYKSMVNASPADVSLNKSGIIVEAGDGKLTNYNQENQSLMRFFLLHVVSEGMEDHNPMPMPGLSGKPRATTLLDKQRQRDDYLREWQYRFLATYRTNPEDPRSDFYPVYVPDAPPPPEIDRAYVGGAIKLSAITGQQFPIYAMRPEVDKAFVSKTMREVLGEIAPEEIPDVAAQSIRVPVPGNYQPPQQRGKNAQGDQNGQNGLAGGGNMMMPGGGGGAAAPAI